MLHTEIDALIKNAMLEHNSDLLRIYRLIKNEFVKAEKGAEGERVELTDVNEAKILLKMATQREDSIRQYIDGGRPELAEDEKAELDVIKGFLPKQVTDEEIEDYTRAVIPAYKMTKDAGYTLSMRDMKPIMLLVQEKYPSANGAVISKVLKSLV